jgi:hypothetical protein
MKSKAILIKKASGEQQAFESEKLRDSLLNAGASKNLTDRIVNNINQWVFSGATTNQIYSRAFSLLRKAKTKASFRYKMKQAILQFGDTGYPFEFFIGELLKRKGYSTRVGVHEQGLCVKHEIDVVGSTDKQKILVECKYSPNRKKQVSIQVPLYVKSRMDDVISFKKQQPEFKDFNFIPAVVTNTRFSSESIKYGQCAGIQLISWDYPKNFCLKSLIAMAEIYPITLLNYLTKYQKRALIDDGVVVCQQLYENMDLLNELNLKPNKKASIIQELKVLCE